MPDIKTGSFSITGLSDLEKRLAELPLRIAKNVMRGAIRAGAVVIQKEAKAKCPVSAEAHFLGKGVKRVLIQPGELKKKGIKVRQAPRSSSPLIAYWVYVSKRNWYWGFPEFGTAKMTARPFMRPAFDEKKEAATEAIRAYMGPRIDKEVAKLGH